MKTLYFITLAFLYVNATPHLLGAKECTWGPSYWCSNLTAAAGCRAVRHCIQTVWEHKTYPEDTDSVCQTCLSMVKQARDQLESNETQEEIKEVFEGSCKLIPIKIVNQECCKLADEFIPELIDTLASQMNPQMVCSVAGLCNNAKIDKLLIEHADEIVTKHPVQVAGDTCAGCHKVVDIMEQKFKGLSRDGFLQKLLHVCAKMGSFSDACSNIIITYFTEIYNHMTSNFNADNVCILSGECSMNFHVHEVEITLNSDVGVVVVDDDLPCDLCKQLVGHLRELLIANTTEDEFKMVLDGLCKQTQGFKDQCLSIVNEYYPVIYGFLVSELNSTTVCTMINICPASGLSADSQYDGPIIPLLPVGTVPLTTDLVKENKLHKVGTSNQGSSVKVIQQEEFDMQTPDLMQLPIERMNGPHMDRIFSKELCVFCEYFLHYVQEAITNPRTEQSIKDIVDRACTILPSSINETCLQFVTTYGDAMVAILAQEIDPSTICPLIQVCPAEQTDIEVFMKSEAEPNCPMCLFAVTKLEEEVKDSRTRSSIKKALKNLCTHFNGHIAEECQDFVNTYTDELVEMLVDDFKPQEVCVYLKICKDNRPAPKITDIDFGGSINTNEIPDFTANGVIINPAMRNQVTNKPQCVLCEFVMDKLENMLKNKSTEEEIKTAIHDVCNDLPKTISAQCNTFVDQYADMVFSLIIAAVKPDEICAVMNLCDKKTEIVPPPPANIKSPQCVICKLVMQQIETLLVGKVSEDDIKTALDTVCSILPKEQEESCDTFVRNNYESIYKFLSMAVAPGELCSMMFLCETALPEVVKLHINKCAVCEATVLAVDKILLNPKVDHSIEHVMEKACRALPVKDQLKCKNIIEEYGSTIFNLVDHEIRDTREVCKDIGICSAVAFRPKRALLGTKECLDGPGFWCESEKQALACGNVAHQHCVDKVWKNKKPSS